MSTDKTAPQERPARLGKRKLNVDKGAGLKLPAISEIDVSSLQIDDSSNDDYDPYNCTGQFLVDALKKKLDDQT